LRNAGITPLGANQAVLDYIEEMVKEHNRCNVITIENSANK